MYIVYKDKYGLLAGFVYLFETLEEVEKYIRENNNCNFTYKVKFVEKYGGNNGV